MRDQVQKRKHVKRDQDKREQTKREGTSYCECKLQGTTVQ